MQDQKERLKKWIYKMPWDSSEREAVESSIKKMTDDEAKELADKLERFINVDIPEMRESRLDILVREDLKKLVDGSSVDDNVKEKAKKFIDNLNIDDVEFVAKASTMPKLDIESFFRVWEMMEDKDEEKIKNCDNLSNNPKEILRKRLGIKNVKVTIQLPDQIGCDTKDEDNLSSEDKMRIRCGFLTPEDTKYGRDLIEERRERRMNRIKNNFNFEYIWCDYRFSGAFLFLTFILSVAFICFK